MSQQAEVQIVWFKRDLRIDDHHPLSLAAERGPVLPLLVVEPEWWAEPDMAERQYSFFRESAIELRTALAERGQPPIIRVGSVLDVLSEISEIFSIAGLWSHEETGNAWTFARDRRVRAWCRARGVVWNELRQDGVVRALASRDGWAGRWDKTMAAPIIAAPPRLQSLSDAVRSERLPEPAELGLAPDGCNLRQTGGRAAGRRMLDSFLNERGETYRSAMSSPVAGERACSRLSPHLAWGTVSMREVAQTTWARQRALKQLGGTGVRQWRGSLISFTGRLHWHCHFMQKLESEPALEFRNLHPAYNGIRRPQQTDASRLAAWCAGETGLPFVDACMRYLRATGWLNFRMRAMLMATSSYHLWLDWREPGLHLARQFTDYEPGIHWPQAQMQSGTTGINTVRIYNPVKQGYDQDPDGAFVRRWVPELEALAGAAVHEPWKHADAAGILDRTYPMPIVDHVAAAREARQRIYAARKGQAFRATADAIQDKHGSRKSGMAMTGAKGRSQTATRKRSEDSQFAFELLEPHSNGDVVKSK